MKCSLVAVGLVAVVTAQNPSVVSKISVLSSQLASAFNPPPSIVPELLTLVPSSVLAAFQNPTALPALASALTAAPPAWFTSLPADAKSWIMGAEGAYASIEPQLMSLQAVATANISGITTSGSVAGTSVSSSLVVAKSTSYANSTVTTVKSSTTGSSSTKAATLTTSSSVASSSKASSSSSSGGAASPTGAVAAGLAGAVGILGLALAL